MRSLFNTLRFLSNHPLSGRHKREAFSRFVLYQISKVFNPYPILYSFTAKSKLIIEKGMTGATGNLYCGLHEFEDMGFLLHFLRPNDLFVDVGANIGSYTILASAHIGCRSIAFEPVPATYDKLIRNINVNGIQFLASAYNRGVGAEAGSIAFTTEKDTMNGVALERESGKTIDVDIDLLNHFLSDQVPILMKVDVEGYEMEVIRGGDHVLGNPGLKALIIELNGSGEKYGFQDSEIHATLLRFGFLPFSYDPYRRALKELSTFGAYNTLYLRDAEEAEVRLREAISFEVFNQTI